MNDRKLYQPTSNLLEGIRHAWQPELFPWDEYFLEMAEADVLCGRGEVGAAKSFFIRDTPFGSNGSFCLLGGITAAMRDIMDVPIESNEYSAALHNLGFGSEIIQYFRQHGRIKIRVYAPPEGTVFFQQEPIITIVGPLPFVRLCEGIIIEKVNSNSMYLTDWERAVRAAAPESLNDQSRRRSPNAKRSALNALLAGCTSSSNMDLRASFEFPLMGTQGHEWPMSFGDVKEAHRQWLKAKPHKPFCLVDTTQTLEVDFPAFLEAISELRTSIKEANPPFWGPRNDSGDLAYLVVEEYARFLEHELAGDAWLTERLRFPLANDLDEYLILDIKAQIRVLAEERGVDGEDIISRILWGIGTSKGSSKQQSSLGGVMKLAYCEDPTIKLALGSDGNAGMKTSIPGWNFSARIYVDRQLRDILIYPKDHYRLYEEEGILRSARTGELLRSIVACHPDIPSSRITLANYHAVSPQKLVYDTVYGNGLTNAWDNPTLTSVAEYVQAQINSLPSWMKRFVNPARVKVSLTEDLYDLRQRMISQKVIRADNLIGAVE